MHKAEKIIGFAGDISSVVGVQFQFRVDQYGDSGRIPNSEMLSGKSQFMAYHGVKGELAALGVT
jgi:hypothetical protein